MCEYFYTKAFGGIIHEQTNEEQQNLDIIKENLRLFLSPYGTVCVGSGKINFSINVNAFDIKDWKSFLDNFSVIAGYKVQIW